MSAAGFVPPPYPYDRLDALAAAASSVDGGLVDLSVGTPCDPAPDMVVQALATSGAERGYPSSAGSPDLRQAAVRYLQRRFDAHLGAGQVAACVGTKEFVASAAWYLRLRDPGRDTVLGPRLAYPTYAMGAELAGCRYVPVGERDDGSPDVDALPAGDVERALVLWLNSPANPSGAVFDVAGCAAWGRDAGVPVLSDECYAEFTWDGPARTVLSDGSNGVLALHSLSKRSNLAGARVGFYAGDADLVHYLSEVRKHAGLMVPGPVQHAARVALDDDAHVAAQRHRYRRRLTVLSDALAACGIEAPLPAGSFYLWATVPPWAAARGAGDRGGDWVLTEALATRAGILVSPGSFYGEAGAGHVRIAVVQPDDRIDLATKRLADAGSLEA